MTDRTELRQLQNDLAYYGVKVTYAINEQGWIDAVFIVGKGIREIIVTGKQIGRAHV